MLYGEANACLSGLKQTRIVGLCLQPKSTGHFDVTLLNEIICESPA